ncbi:hypothetical protein ACHWQZ_G012818 [Mnemiopsis leidyi]
MLTFHLDITVLKNKLTSNGFLTHLIDMHIGAVLGRHHANISQPSTTDVPRKEVLVVMPYLGPVSHLVKKQLTKLVHKFYFSVELKFVYRRGFRTANMFNYRDKFPLSCKSMVVYYTQCKQCGPSAAYWQNCQYCMRLIGKTVNTVYERFFASGTGHHASDNKNSALLDHLFRTDTESSDSRAGTSTPPQTPPIPYTPVVKEFTIKETSPINNEELRPRTETTQIVPPLPIEKKSSSPNLTEGEEQEPPTPTFRVGICLKSLNTTLEQADL